MDRRDAVRLLIYRNLVYRTTEAEVALTASRSNNPLGPSADEISQSRGIIDFSAWES
jgi:hypothetical protein